MLAGELNIIRMDRKEVQNHQNKTQVMKKCNLTLTDWGDALWDLVSLTYSRRVNWKDCLYQFNGRWCIFKRGWRRVCGRRVAEETQGGTGVVNVRKFSRWDGKIKSAFLWVTVWSSLMLLLINSWGGFRFGAETLGSAWKLSLSKTLNSDRQERDFLLGWSVIEMWWCHIFKLRLSR